MAHTEWSTDSLAERDRFAFWREELLAPLGIAAEPDSSASCVFHARVTHRSKGPLTHLRVEADAHRVMRRSREIARRLRRGYSVYLENGEGTWFRYGGLEYPPSPATFSSPMPTSRGNAGPWAVTGWKPCCSLNRCSTRICRRSGVRSWRGCRARAGRRHWQPIFSGR